MGKIKGWNKVQDDKYGARWQTQIKDFKIGDVYYTIDVIHPNIRKKEIGYFEVQKQIVNWVSGVAHSTNPTDIVRKHIIEMNRESGIQMAMNYMRANPHG